MGNRVDRGAQGGMAGPVRVRDIIAAAKFPDVLPTPHSEEFGLWRFRRVDLKDAAIPRFLVGANTLTMLEKLSMLRMNQDQPYEVVMEDSNTELRRHAPIFRHGRGRILISGLGLGCVVRGLLTKPEVEHIDVVEIDRRIIDRFGAEFADDARVEIHHGDALSFPWPESMHWDVAWHDIHCIKEDNLVRLHARLVERFLYQCDRQGWWGAGGRVARRAARPGYFLAA
jgi:hypothetical protein